MQKAPPSGQQQRQTQDLYQKKPTGNLNAIPSQNQGYGAPMTKE
jgi:hypothetical protein